MSGDDVPQCRDVAQPRRGVLGVVVVDGADHRGPTPCLGQGVDDAFVHAPEPITSTRSRRATCATRSSEAVHDEDARCGDEDEEPVGLESRAGSLNVDG